MSFASSRRPATFHPQRLYPRYASAFAAAARVPGGLSLSTRTLGRLAMDRSPSATENPTAELLGNAQVAVCGFPRTGTTFMQSALAALLGDPRSVFKNHDVLAIDTFVEWGIPTLVPLRHPVDAVASWCLYNDDEPTSAAVRRRLRTYVAWHRELRRHLDEPSVRVVDFGEFRAGPAAALASALGTDESTYQLNSVTPHAVVLDVSRANEDDGLALVQRNTPSTLRDEMKLPFMEMIDNRRLASDLRAAERLYSDLLSLTSGAPEHHAIVSAQISQQPQSR